MSGSDCPHYLAKNLVESVQGRFIYKDECAKCFVNQRSEEGVNLCLGCLVGGCNSHSLLHAKQKNHPIVINFKTKLKPKLETEEPKKTEITKIAIGKPGGADFTGEEWELHTEVKCLECNKSLDPTKFSGIIESVIKAESASEKSAISAWELEIKPCPHSMTLVQTSDKKLADKSLAHCSECELSTNLWLCLFCGFLGCGRKNYDGTGGNNHAREHHTQTGHSVVVKLGTITPDGKASVYCYGCDEDVEDEKLSEHLANFGINISKLQKTEKTMAELNLQLNLNLTLSSVIEKGRKITPVFGKGFTGIQNLGNSCYMNSVLQSLFVLDEFKDRYFQEGLKHLESCTSYTPECFICQMSKIGHGLYSGEYSERKESKPMEIEGQTEKIELEPYQDGIRPFMFKMLVGKGHPEFSTDRQQDAAEYLRHLFTFVQKAEKKANLSDITKIFNFKLFTLLSCMRCHGYKTQETVSQDIQLPIAKSDKFKEEEDPTNDKAPEKIPLVDFEECLKAYQTEIVSLHCPKCKENSNFKKETYIKTWPKYLLVEMSRIVADNWVPRKDVSELVFNSDVQDLSRFKIPQLDPNLRLNEESGQDEGPQASQEAVEQLTMMGFGENRAKRALIAKNNNVEEAMNWLIEKIDDNSLDAPLESKKSTGPSVPQEMIDMITGMGFSEKQARFSLSQTNNDPERAIDYLFNHPEIEDLINQSEKKEAGGEKGVMEIEDNGPTTYNLKAVVVHLGKNYGSGHYVCYVKKDNQWIYFNDSKVAHSTDPAIGKGVIYLFERTA